MLTRERLKSVLAYDPETGVFTRHVRIAGARVGPVGSMGSHGYLSVVIDGERYCLHRLAFLYMLGRWPFADGEHRDGDKTNNRWNNLRDATRSQNKANVGLTKANRSGRKGVYFDPARGSWIAKFSIDGGRRFIGRFATADQASAAYEKAVLAAHGEFARVA